MSKSFIWGFIAGLTLLVGAGVGASKLQDKDKQQYQIEFADATPVQPGEMTEKQRVHARLFNRVGQPVGGQTLSQWIVPYKRQKIVLITSRMGRMFLASDQPQSPEEYFGKLANESDAIIRGKVKSKSSHFTEDDLFIFTDYDVSVLEIIKNNRFNPIQLDTTVPVIGLGGKVIVDNVILKATGNYDAILPINGQDVLLFLKYIPETESYQFTMSNAAFELNGISARPLAGMIPLSSDIFRDKSSFINTIKTVSTK
jgi:hypothetical protein